MPQPAEALSPKLAHVGSASMVLKRLTDNLKRQKASKILDLGPACQENIDFFARRSKQFYVFDLFTQLNQTNVKADASYDEIWKQLDFPPDSFDCINLWDLLDHLKDTEALKIIQRCHKMVKPYGLVLVMAMEKALHPRHTSLFAYGQNNRLIWRTLPNMRLSSYFRHNRALISLLTPFKPIISFRYYSGIREMLFQRTNQVS